MTESTPTTDSWWRRAARRLRIQFTIRGLLVLTFATAVGLSVVRAEGKSRIVPDLFYSEYGHGVLAAVAACFLLGLVNQVRDLWSTYHRRTDLDSEERWGWRLAALWRVAAGLLLFGGYIEQQLHVRKLIVWPDPYMTLGISIPSIPSVLLDLVLFVVVYSVPTTKVQKRPAKWNRFMDGMAFMVGLLFGVFLVWQSNLMMYLVHVAITGLEFTEPFNGPHAALVNNLVAREHQFLFYSIAGGISCLCSFLLLRQMARQWQCGARRRLMWGGPFAISVVASAVYPVWVYATGLEQVAPFMRAEILKWPSSVVALGVVFLLVAVSLGTARLLRGTDQTGAEENRAVAQNWRQRPDRYYHEKALVLLPLFALPLFNTAQFLYFALRRELPGMFLSTGDYLTLAVNRVPVYLASALALLSLHRFVRTVWRRTPLPPQTPRIRIDRFCAVWFGLLCVIVASATTLCWLSFALYFGTWWHRLVEAFAT